MKKITLLVGSIIIGAAAFGQSQRLVLGEEYTQASCPPCASQNPPFQTLMLANASKMISVRYQTSWPGTDPMNAQYKTDLTTRTNYYAINGVPEMTMDGVMPTGASYAGSPSNLTSAKITTEYGIASPFTMTTTYNFNAANDSVFINCTITASQAYTSSGALKGHIALIEKTITFTTAPGSNGEKVFYNVVRKMFPGPTGTTLPSTWTNGQSQTITVKAKIPTYIYKKTELAVVAFVQSDGDKKIQQSSYAPTASATSMNEVADVLSSFNVFPNPATDNASVDFNLVQPGNIVISVMNTLGQEVINANLGVLAAGAQKYALNVESLNAGTYFVNIKVGEASLTKSITVNR